MPTNALTKPINLQKLDRKQICNDA